MTLEKEKRNILQKTDVDEFHFGLTDMGTHMHMIYRLKWRIASHKAA